eukprot:m.86050 g.86050  ORF g.86050 m.86050 type:complete len:285 (-) comp25921_c0_seq1:146-1000(-)
MINDTNDAELGWEEKYRGRYSFPRSLAVFGTDAQQKQQLYVYNFGYGSNLSPTKMIERGIIPVSSQRATLANWRLEFNQFGIPPVEPSFANVMESVGDVVHGVLFQLTLDDFQTLFVGEGDGGWYNVAASKVETYPPDCHAYVAAIFTSKESKLTHDRRGVPSSTRYKNLLVQGAKEMKLDADYVHKLEQLPSVDAFLIVQLFLYFRILTHQKLSQLDTTTWVGWCLLKGDLQAVEMSRWCCIHVYNIPVVRDIVAVLLNFPFLFIFPLVKFVVHPMYKVKNIV